MSSSFLSAKVAILADLLSSSSIFARPVLVLPSSSCENYGARVKILIRNFSGNGEQPFNYRPWASENLARRWVMHSSTALRAKGPRKVCGKIHYGHNGMQVNLTIINHLDALAANDDILWQIPHDEMIPILSRVSASWSCFCLLLLQKLLRRQHWAKCSR